MRDRSKESARRAEIIAANVGRLCPPDHKHALTATCYNHHGCRCLPCREVRARKRRRSEKLTNLIQGRDVWVPCIGAQRRLQALACLGWSPQVIAEKIGSHYRPLSKIRGGERTQVRLSTHRRIDKVYRALCMQQAPDHSGAIQRAYAARKGWVPPLAWEDIDDPADRGSVAERCGEALCARAVYVAGVCWAHRKEAA